MVGFDFLGDIRDLIYDFTNWKWTWGHAGQTTLDVVSFLPLIGTLKYTDEAGALIKGASKYVDEAADTLQEAKHFDEVLDGADEVKLPEGAGSSTIKGFEAPKVYTNAKGQFTNGIYTIDSTGMSPHINGSTAGKSQFLFNVDANKAVLDGAVYADKYNLWSNGKAKVFIENGPVGVHGSTGELTNWLNIYKTKTGFVHGAPGTP